jgi:hypothetical protein
VVHAPSTREAGCRKVDPTFETAKRIPTDVPQVTVGFSIRWDGLSAQEK